jgi:hypothetical protein
VLRALLALSRREPSQAIELLESAAPYELGTPRSNLQGLFGALYPVYVRGEAYLAARQGTEAIAEFQKILDHRGIVISDPIGHSPTCEWAGQPETMPKPSLPTRISLASGRR